MSRLLARSGKPDHDKRGNGEQDSDELAKSVGPSFDLTGQRAKKRVRSHLDGDVSDKPSLGTAAAVMAGDEKPGGKQDSKGDGHHQPVEVQIAEPYPITTQRIGFFGVSKQNPQVVQERIAVPFNNKHRRLTRLTT